MMLYSQVDEGIFRGPRIKNFGQMWNLVSQEKIKTILNLQIGLKEMALGELKEEPGWCQLFGVRFLDMDLCGFVPPPTNQIIEAASYLDDKKFHPIYVHCRHGRERTGLVVAAFRILHRGWRVEQAYEEMISHGSRLPYSWLARYSLSELGKR